jgi:hypothetical protein
MGVLYFRLRDVGQLLQPAVVVVPSADCAAHPVEDDVTVVDVPAARVLLVHDLSVYLMATTADAEQAVGPAVFADGLDPRTNGDWPMLARSTVGADAFAEDIAVEMLREACAGNPDGWLEVAYTENSLAIRSIDERPSEAA